MDYNVVQEQNGYVSLATMYYQCWNKPQDAFQAIKLGGVMRSFMALHVNLNWSSIVPNAVNTPLWDTFGIRVTNGNNQTYGTSSQRENLPAGIYDSYHFVPQIKDDTKTNTINQNYCDGDMY